MNINNLEENTTIKNYKELCRILEIKQYTNTAAKQKQLEELNIYCDYTRQGNKYIIKEVYKNPTITIKDILKNKNNKYIEILSNIILEYLYKSPEELRDLPLIKLFSILGITNINYKYANSYRKELSQLYNIHLASIYYFYDNTRNEYKKIIERCLNNLQKRSILFWNKCIIIVNKDKSLHKADEEMKKLILDTQKDILEELKVNSIVEIIKSKNKRKLFNSMIQKELNFNYFYAYDIVIGNKAIKIEYDKLKENKDNINKLMVDKTAKMFDKNKYKHFKDEYNSLIDLLINSDTTEEIKDILIKQKEINLDSYINSVIDEELKHSKNLEEIKELYIDTYEL